MSTNITMYNDQELPSLSLAWTDATGALIDFSSGWTFTVKLSRTTAPATTLYVKTSGITGSNGSTGSNLVIDWSTTDWAGLEAAVNGTSYYVNVTARRTSDTKDRYFKPDSPITLKLKAAPGTSAVSPSSYPVTVTAASVTLADTGNYFAATNVEDALAEHVADTVDAHDASAISVLDTAGYYTATTVEAALAEIAGTSPKNKNTVVLLGDSFTSEARLVTGTEGTFGSFVQYPVTSYWTWARAFLRERLNVVNYAGVAGESSTSVLARFQSAVVAYNPGWCILLTGANDSSIATLKSNVLAMIDQARVAGIRMVILTMPPKTSATTAYLNMLHEYNQWLKQLAHSTRDLIVVDTFPLVANPASPSDYIAAGSVKYSSDGTHFGPWGAAVVGRKLADVLIPHVPEVDVLGFGGADSAARTFSNKNIHPNPGLTGTAGSLLFGSTGVSPDSVSVTASNSAALAGTVTSSIVAASSSDLVQASWHQVVNSGVASQLRVIASTTTNWSVGDRVQGSIEFDASTTDWSSCSVFRVLCNCFNASFSNVSTYGFSYRATDFASVNTPPAAFAPLNSIVIRTPSFVIPTGTTTVFLGIDFTGLGTVKYRRPELRLNPLVVS